jgi:general stress protein 26
MGTDGYEEVTTYPLADEARDHILSTQNECSFLWGTKEHWPIGVIMNFLWRDGKFWLTATSQRARIAAVRRDPRVSIIVSSAGTDLGGGRSITVKGRVAVREEREVKDWFYPALASALFPGADSIQAQFMNNLDSDRRVILEVSPEKWITFDASKMMADTIKEFAHLA